MAFYRFVGGEFAIINYEGGGASYVLIIQVLMHTRTASESKFEVVNGSNQFQAVPLRILRKEPSPACLHLRRRR